MIRHGLYGNKDLTCDNCGAQITIYGNDDLKPCSCGGKWFKNFTHWIDLDACYLAKKIVNESSDQELIDFIIKIDELGSNPEFTKSMLEYFKSAHSKNKD